jgi:Leucine-rich repeat (LRR) protein
MEIDFKDYVKNGNYLHLQHQSKILNDHNNLEKLCSFLKNNPHITALNLKGCNIDNAKIKLLIAPIKQSKITILDISSNQLYDVDAAEIAELINLTTLNISCNQLTTKGAAKLSTLSNLVVLNLSYNSLVSNKWAVKIDEPTELAKLNNLSELTKLTKLNELKISGNNLGPKEAEVLAQLSNLTTLHIPRNNIGSEGVAAIVNNIPNIFDLDVSDNNLDDKGAIEVVKLPLTKLAIKSNKIGDEGVQAIIANLQNLSELDMSCNDITDAVLDEIVASVPEKITKLDLKRNPNISYSGIEKLAVIKNTNIIISDSEDIEELFLKFLQCGNITSESIKNIVFEIARMYSLYNNAPLIQHIINSPEKYPFAINSRDNEGHSLLSFYNHFNPEMQPFLFQHGAVPDTEQKQDRLKTLARDTQSVHTTEAVKLVNFITDNLFKAYGNIENKQQLLVKAEEYQAGLTKLDQVYQNSIKLKLLSLSDGAKRDTMKKTLVANQPTPSDQDYVATVIEKAKIALTTIYLGKTNGHYNQGYPTHKMEYGDGHKITIPQSLGLVKSLIDTMEIPVAEKLELLVTLMRQNPELVKSKLEIIQDKLNIDVPPTILVDSTKCHKFLASNPVIKKTPQIIGDLFNSISDLDINQTWREQKAFIVAENIYIAATAYGKGKTACLQGVWEDIVNSVTEINKDFYNEFIKLQEQNLEEERARTSITENNIQEFIGVLAKKLINFVEDKPVLQERLADLDFVTIDMEKPQYISIEQQEFLAQINTAFAEIKKYLPNYNREIPTSDEYDLIIKMLAKHPLIEKFATDHYTLQESALQLEDYISAHLLVKGSSPLDDQDGVEIIGDEGY